MWVLHVVGVYIIILPVSAKKFQTFYSSAVYSLQLRSCAETNLKTEKKKEEFTQVRSFPSSRIVQGELVWCSSLDNRFGREITN